MWEWLKKESGWISCIQPLYTEHPNCANGGVGVFREVETSAHGTKVTSLRACALHTRDP
jgi:hypothetical protein